MKLYHGWDLFKLVSFFTEQWPIFWRAVSLIRILSSKSSPLSDCVSICAVVLLPRLSADWQSVQCSRAIRLQISMRQKRLNFSGCCLPPQVSATTFCLKGSTPSHHYHMQLLQSKPLSRASIMDNFFCVWFWNPFQWRVLVRSPTHCVLVRGALQGKWLCLTCVFSVPQQSDMLMKLLIIVNEIGLDVMCGEELLPELFHSVTRGTRCQSHAASVHHIDWLWTVHMLTVSLSACELTVVLWLWRTTQTSLCAPCHLPPTVYFIIPHAPISFFFMRSLVAVYQSSSHSFIE